MKTLADFGFTADSFGFLILLFSAMFLLLAVIFAALFYAQAYGIYRMARKLSIKSTWKSLVPVLNVFFFGDLADSAAAINFNRRVYKKLISFFYVLKIAAIAVFVFSFVKEGSALIFAAEEAMIEGAALNSQIFEGFNLSFILLLVAVAVSFLLRIVKTCATVQIFRQFSLNHPVAVAVLGFFIPIILPFVFVSICKNDPIGKHETYTLKSNVGFHIDEQ